MALAVSQFHDGCDTPTPSSLSCLDAGRDISINDAGTSEEEDNLFRQDAVLSVGAIIGRATHDLDDMTVCADAGDDSLQMQEPDSAAVAEIVEPPACAQQTSPTRAAPALMGTGAVPNPQRASDIAKILKASRGSAEIRQYAERVGFGRTPGHLREVIPALDAEQQYIMTLQEVREDGPKAFVRLLEEGEKATILQALKSRFQLASAHALQAKPRSKARSDLEADLERIRQDMASLSRPYIFVEVPRQSTAR